MQRAQCDSEQLLNDIAAHVRACHLHVVATQAVSFDHDGLTLVWVLAESHVVLHVWPELRSATLDLHICNYGASNAANARALRDRLAEACFATGRPLGGVGHWLGHGSDRPACSVWHALRPGGDPAPRGPRHRVIPSRR